MTTPVHGNYQGYYQKRPSICDPRLALLSPGFFSEKVILDVGCNEGWVSCEVAQQWGAKKVVGVDIDEGLIRNAWKRRKTLWSLERPAQSNPEDTTGAHYFPASLAYSFGPIPFPSVSLNETSGFPHNVIFRTVDWVKDDVLEDKDGYDVILGFSISKWIHLNGGDDGIRQFFRRVYDTLRPGGIFLLEPQPWDGYAKAKRMDERLRTTYQSLLLRPESFGEVLERFGFGPGERLGKTGDGGFRRPIDMYKKI